MSLPELGEMEQRLRAELAEAVSKLQSAATIVGDLCEALTATNRVLLLALVTEKLSALPAEERARIEADPVLLAEFTSSCVSVAPLTPTNTATPNLGSALASVQNVNTQMEQMVYWIEQATQLGTSIGLQILLA